MEQWVSLMRGSLKDPAVLDDWKKADVLAIYTESDTNSPANYKPVRLTSNVRS